MKGGRRGQRERGRDGRDERLACNMNAADIDVVGWIFDDALQNC